MGMGEPLDNFTAVKNSIILFTMKQAFCIAEKNITVSTVGVTDKIMLMAEEMPKISLAFSLHAPNQQLRESIVPITKK